MWYNNVHSRFDVYVCDFVCVLSTLFVSAIYILHNYLKMPTTERTTTEQLLLMRQQQQQQQPHSKRLTIHMSDKAYQNRAAPQIIKVKQDKSVENELETFLSWLRSFYKSWEICQRTSRNVATFSFFFSPVIRTFSQFSVFL